MTTNSATYNEKKRFLNQVLTIYGRNPVMEALQNDDIEIFRLHLADSNKPAKIINDIIAQATSKGAEILYHGKKELSRISKNAKQDQGIAIDIKMTHFSEIETLLDLKGQQEAQEFIALDKLTNPQNIGMIIRSVCASPSKGLIIPRQGCAKLDSLVIKASAGTLFKANIIRCDDLEHGLKKAKNSGFNIVGLDASAKINIKSYKTQTPTIFVMGNETDGLSKATQDLCTHKVNIPMNNNVESLNVAVTASLIAFRHVL